MRRNRKNSIRKERIIMIASSAFVLAALTMTGVYMKEKSVESKDDGYTVDFTALEESVENKYQEIARNDSTDVQENVVAQDNSVAGNNLEQAEQNMENDLDYMPLEVGSGLVEIPGLTDGIYSQEENAVALEGAADEADLVAEEAVIEEADEEASADDVVVSRELHFAEEDGLLRPTVGEILMPYSMDGSIYFATLDQYKYNPAVIFSAQEGSQVTACAEGKIVEVYEDAKIGNAVTIDLGDGYQATYGQLKEIQVSEGSYVNPGDAIGSVAAPTKYYSVEGSNLYFRLTRDGEPVNPEGLF